MLLTNQISKKTLSMLEMWLSKQPYFEKLAPDGQIFYKYKHLDYHIANSIPNQLLKPIIDSILPNANVQTYNYVESYIPFDLHVDTIKESINRNEYAFDNASSITYNSAVLIPLDEGENLRTVIFDVKCDEWKPGMSANYITDIDNGLREDDFSHVNELDRPNIKYLPLLEDNQWKRGDVITWDRKYLHLACNFRKHVPFKRALTLFFH
jgi:hypothetical protein